MKIDGLPVVDAKAPFKLVINKNDVRKGASKDADSCAAALACMRQMECTAAKVHMGRIYVLSGKKWYRYDTPQSLRSEIIAFDRRHEFSPGIYNLRPPRPSDVAARGKRKGSKTNQSARLKSRKRISPHFITGVRGRMHDYENAK